MQLYSSASWTVVLPQSGPHVLQKRNVLLMATCCRYAIIRMELSQNTSLLQQSSYVGMSEISPVMSAATLC